MLAGKRRVPLAETIKNIRQKVGSNAGPRVFHGELQMGLDPLDDDIDIAVARRELDRVG